MLAKYKPGQGWRCIGVPVWERNGVRIHCGGALRLSDGSIFYARSWPLARRFWALRRICGGNERRALMVLANELEQEGTQKP